MRHARRTRPIPLRTRTIHGVPAPLHLPATGILRPEDFEVRPPFSPIGERFAHLADERDTIVVDVEVNAAGQIVITGAERGS